MSGAETATDQSSSDYKAPALSSSVATEQRRDGEPSAKSQLQRLTAEETRTVATEQRPVPPVDDVSVASSSQFALAAEFRHFSRTQLESGVRSRETAFCTQRAAETAADSRTATSDETVRSGMVCGGMVCSEESPIQTVDVVAGVISSQRRTDDLVVDSLSTQPSQG